jgi:hypothetical protein
MLIAVRAARAVAGAALGTGWKETIDTSDKSMFTEASARELGSWGVNSGRLAVLARA